jgi:hypothetical protein
MAITTDGTGAKGTYISKTQTTDIQMSSVWRKFPRRWPAERPSYSRYHLPTERIWGCYRWHHCASGDTTSAAPSVENHVGIREMARDVPHHIS